MRALWMALLSLGVLSSPAGAATLNPSNAAITGGGGGTADLFNVTLNLVQQWTMPITVNHAVAIGINSSNVAAAAETNVISVNETAIFTGNLTGPSSGPNLADVPWLRELLGQSGISLPQVAAAGQPVSGNGGAAPAPIPVPAALPLMLGALGALGWLGRPARRTVAA